MRRRPQRRAHEKEEIEEENCDEHEAADEDVRAKSHVGFVLGKIWRRNVSVFVIVHAYQLRRKTSSVLTFLIGDVCRSYSSRPGRAMSSRMASWGPLLWWRMASTCSVMGISTA